jgi:DNA modification methylase
MPENSAKQNTIGGLTPNPKNPRTITDAKLAQLRNALVEFGDLGGFVFNRKSKQLVGGHQRAKLFEADTPIIYERKYKKPTTTGTIAEGYVVLNNERFKYREVWWDSVTEKAANIAANKGAGDWDATLLTDWFKDLDALDFNLDLTMFDESEREKYLGKESKAGLTDDDAVPDKVPARAKLGQIWQLGVHRLMCGDSTNEKCVAKLMMGEKAEMCFTSPPYADQRDYGVGLELHPDQLASFLTASCHVVSYYAVNLGYSRKDGEVNPYWNYYLDKAKANGLKLLSWNVWDKGECGSIGNQTAMFGISHEWIFVFGREKKELNRTVDNISAGYLANRIGNRQKDGSVKKQKDRIVGSHSQLKTIYQCTPQKARDDINHPARFPVEFPCGYIEAMTDESQVVYEPFGGSGSTLIACEKTNRKCYMMELDPHYCDVIVARWEQFTGQKAKLLNNKATTRG